MKHPLALVDHLIICVCISLMSSSATAQTGDKRQAIDVTVETNGSGSTSAEARKEAIRSALQQVVPQIIVADRIVKDDKLIMDSVMSSMNGHVQSITTLEERRSGDRVDGSYRITVSTSEISSFLTSRFGSSANVDGNSLSGEMMREREARGFRDQYIRRLFRGYPSRVINTEVIDTNSDPIDFTKLIIKFKASLDIDWINSLRSSLREISCAPSNGLCSDSPVCFRAQKKNFFGMLIEDNDCFYIKPGPGKSTEWDIDRNSVRYPSLDPELFGKSHPSGIYFAVELLDDQGSPLTKTIYYEGENKWGRYFLAKLRLDSSTLSPDSYYFNPSVQEYRAVVDTNKFDVAKMKEVRITPVLRRPIKEGGYMIGMDRGTLDFFDKTQYK